MKKELINLAECLAQDQKFVEEFSKKKTVDEQYAFAQTKVKGYSKDEFIEFMKNLEEAYKLKNELSPEDLEAASGGSAGMTKLAALAMLGLTFTGGAMNMATSLPTAAVNPATSATVDSFRTLVNDVDNYNCSESQTSGRQRDLLKLAFEGDKEGCKNVINEACQSRKGLRFNRHTGGLYTYWSIELDSPELPSIFTSNSILSLEPAQTQAKSILRWMSGKYLYFDGYGNFQMQCADGSFKNINYELFKSDIEGDVPANAAVFKETVRLVNCLLNRDRALSGALREVRESGLATEVMKDCDISMSGIRNVGMLLQHGNFNYSNSSSGGELRNKILSILKDEKTRESAVSDIRRYFSNSSFSFKHHKASLFRQSTWSGSANVNAASIQGPIFTWLMDKELFYKGNKLQAKFEDGWKYVTYENYSSDFKGARVTQDAFDKFVKQYENELNKARAVRGALEESVELKGQQDLINLVMPEADI